MWQGKFSGGLKVARAIGSQDYDNAIELYSAKLQEDPSDQVARAMIAHCYEWKGDTDNALKHSSHLLTEAPDDSIMLLLAARCWATKGETGQAYELICRYLNLGFVEPPDVPRIGYWIARALGIFPKFRGLYKKVKDGAANHLQSQKKQHEWAMEFKKWYEDNAGTNGGDSTLH